VGIALVVLTATIVWTVNEVAGSCSLRRTYLCVNLFKPLPQTLLTDDEIEFGRLDPSQLSLVRITPAQAARVAQSQYGGGDGSRIVFESLGGYIDKTQIVPDWVGTRSWVPKAIPSYLVRIYDDQIVTVDPSRNHYWNVLVNAVSGKNISAITYD
jgi:hypothetical protein